MRESSVSRGRGLWSPLGGDEAAGAAPALLRRREPGPRLGSLQLGRGRSDPLAPGSLALVAPQGPSAS